MNKLKLNEKAEYLPDKALAERTSLSIGSCRKIAEQAGAVIRVGKSRRTNWEKFKESLEKEYSI